MLNKKSEELKGDNIYYVLLCLNELEQPEYYIVESELIADSMQKGYQQWLQEEGKKKRHETTMRKFAFDVLGVNNVLGLKSYDYKDKWEKLK